MKNKFPPVNIVDIDVSYYQQLEQYYNQNNKSTSTKLSFIIKNNTISSVRPFITFEDLNSNNKTVRCYPLSSFHYPNDCNLRRKTHHFMVEAPSNIAGKIVLNCPIDIPRQFIKIISTNPNTIKSYSGIKKSWLIKCYHEKIHCEREFNLIQSQISEYFTLNKKDHWRYPIVNKDLINKFNKQFIK
mgnify:CR=1 FL=1